MGNGRKKGNRHHNPQKSTEDPSIEDGECSSNEEPNDQQHDHFDNSIVLDASGTNDIAEDTFSDTKSEGESDEDDDGGQDGSKRYSDRFLRSLSSSVLSTMAVEPEAQQKSGSNRQKCFNCGGPHVLAACSEPRDHDRIRREASKFSEMTRRSSTTGARYHVGEKEDKKKAPDFRVGKLSERLRTALAIGPDEIPEWVYRMRRRGVYSGYPPGYLKKAIYYGDSPQDTKLNGDTALLTFHTENSKPSTSKSAEPEDPPHPQINRAEIIYYYGFNISYRRLIDRENIRIPHFDQFVADLQKQVDNEYQDTLFRIRRKRRTKTSVGLDDSKRARSTSPDVIVLSTTNFGRQKADGKSQEEDDDVIVLPPPPPPPPIEIPLDLDEDGADGDQKEEDEGEKNGNAADLVLSPESPEPDLQTPNRSIASSMMMTTNTVESSTPMRILRTAGRKGGGVDDADDDGVTQDVRPDLNAFSEGIIPFQTDAPLQSTGFLNRLKNLVTMHKDGDKKK